MARKINKDTLEQKISKLETAISRNRQQYDQLTKELKKLLDKQKVLQNEEPMKAVADSSRSYEDILRYIKGEPTESEGGFFMPKVRKEIPELEKLVQTGNFIKRACRL